MTEAQVGGQSQGEREFHTICVRCFGKHNEMKHYIAFGMRKSQSGTADDSINLYKLIVDERMEQVTAIEYDSENLVLQSSGGLFDPTGRMTVIDPVNNKVRGTLDDHRIDVTTTEPQQVSRARWCWDFNSINANIGEKYLFVRNQVNTMDLWRAWGVRRSTTVSAVIFKTSIQKHKLQTLIVILASLKYYYNIQQYYQHPVPDGILGLMQKGMPCFPTLSILDNISHVRIRPSFKNSQGHRWFDVIDEASKEICLVISLDSRGLINFQFRDTYGIVQFAVTEIQPETFYSVQDHENINIGSICTGTRVLSAANDRDSHITVIKVDQSHYQQTKHAFQLICHKQPSPFVAAEFYCEYENNTIILSMLKDLDVHKKALALAQTLMTALFFYKIQHKMILPTFPGYTYRQH